VEAVLRSLFRALENLAVLDEAPRRTAMALAIGVGLSFSPFLGLQVLIAVGITLAFRLSRIAVLVGLCANVPWIMLPWYALTTAGAATLLGTSSTVDLNARLGLLLSVPFYRAAFWGHAADLLEAFLMPFLLGPTLGAIALAGLTYSVALRVLTRRAAARLDPPGPPPASVLASDAQERAADGHIHDAQGARFDA
jgi:uncharacterized protein (DUF2062 family)